MITDNPNATDPERRSGTGSDLTPSTATPRWVRVFGLVVLALAIVPLGGASLLTGIVQALVTPWGLLLLRANKASDFRARAN